MDNDSKDAVGKVEAGAKDVVDHGSEYYREGSRALASTVQEQPLGSLVVAAAVGFVLALIINR